MVPSRRSSAMGSARNRLAPASVPPRPRGAPTARGAAGVATSKVPVLTVWFWIAKLLTTGMGETAWDWSAIALGPVVAVGVSFLGFVVAMVLQLRSSTYRPQRYWFAVLMVSVFGTTVADAVHVVLRVPYALSAAVFLLAVLVMFVLWWRTEGTLSIHSITTRRRELFYWSTVILTFALGTAAGDVTASTMQWGYLASILVFGILFAVPVVVYSVTRASAVATFWFAYVFTRPLGASVADWLGVPPARGGVGVGTGLVSLVALVVLAVVVGYLVVTHDDEASAG